MCVCVRLVVLLLPLLVIHSLHLRRTEKLALTFVYLIGLISVACTITRLSIMVQELQPDKGKHLTLASLRRLEMWSIVEFSAAILAFCLPALRGWLVKWVLPDRSARAGDHAPYASHASKASSARQRAKRKNFLATDVSVGGYLEEAVKEMRPPMPSGRRGSRHHVFSQEPLQPHLEIEEFDLESATSAQGGV